MIRRRRTLELALVLFAAAVVTALVLRTPRPSPADSLESPGGEGSATPHDPHPVEGPAAAPGASLLSASTVCHDVGYLCAALQQGDAAVRLHHWPRETSLIRALVPLPAELPENAAKEVQRAAARGLRAWDGHPFRVQVLTRPRAGSEPDLVVEWVRSVAEGRLGRTRMEWTEGGGRSGARVLAFQLSTHHPHAPAEPLTAREVELVAAHEMGHVLGLPHSDDPRDLMYPENTATRLTSRDYRTLAALYALPTGTEIRR